MRSGRANGSASAEAGGYYPQWQEGIIRSGRALELVLGAASALKGGGGPFCGVN